MKKIVSFLLTLALLVGCVAVLSSCGAPKDGGPQIRVYLGHEVYDLDPTDYYVSDNAAQMMSLLYEPLFTLQANGKLANAGASKYWFNHDAREIVIQLAETYWSDGVRVQANDYIYAWRERILNPNNQNPAAALFYDIENALEVKQGASIYSLGVKATGIYELTIKYREGADYTMLLHNLASIATAPVREDAVNQGAGYWSKNVLSTLTNGPFQVQTFDVSTGEFTIARNVGYHQHPDSVRYTDQVTPELLSTFWVDGSQRELLSSDLTDKVIFYLGDDTMANRTQYKADATVTDTLSTYSFVFNTTKAPFNNPSVRRALSLALDRTAMANAVTFGKAATGFLPDKVINTATGKTFSSGNLIATTADMAAAKALIDAAGLTPSQKLITLTVADDEENRTLAALAETAWESLGFTVTVETVDRVVSNVKDFTTGEELDIYDSAVQTLAKNAAAGTFNFDILAMEIQLYSTDAFVPLAAYSTTMSGSGKSFADDQYRAGVSGWSSTAYDKLLDKAYAAADNKTERAEALLAAEAMLAEECPVIPVLFGQNFHFRTSQLSAPGVDYFGNYIFTKVSLKDYEKYFFD